MIAGLGWRLLTEINPRCLWKFLYGFGWNGYRAVERFKSASENGKSVVPFLMISLTDRCNLRCAGCWVSSSGEGRQLDLTDLQNIISEWKIRGVKFFGLLGGEPLLYPELFEIIRQNNDCYFQVFTNGTLLDIDTALQFKAYGNVTPLISIEGLEKESDHRRGGMQVYRKALFALDSCRKAGLVTGVACSVCASNIDDVVSEAFVREVIKQGAHYLWYYIYRPVGADPCPQRALTKNQITGLRRFLVDMRSRVPLIIVDAYWDHDGNALCPAAVGISHHIGPGGDVELCPPLQFSVGSVADGADAIIDSMQLSQARDFLLKNSRGCILLDNPVALARYVKSSGMKDSSGRNAFQEELERMQVLPDHDMGEERIPEKHWLYRFAKKHWFFGFGAYG